MNKLSSDSLLKQVKSSFRQKRFRQDVFLFVLLLLFGVIVMNHVKTVRATERNDNLGQIYKDRSAELAQYEAQYKKLVSDNNVLTKEKEVAVANLLNQKGYEDLQAELSRVRVLAGFTEVAGSGVTLTLNDKPDYDILNDSAESLVHDSDVRYALNLFNNNGAAALAVNGQRIVNSSYVFCIGPTILCNLQRLTPPYIITAIGDPVALANAIRQDPMFNLRQTKEIGLVVNVKEEDEVVIPAFADADDFEKYIDRLEVVKP